MDTPQELKKWKIIVAVLLVLLFVSCTALGISLVLRNHDEHPTVTVPVETVPVETEQMPPETTAETTEAATEATTEAATEATTESTTEAATEETTKPKEASEEQEATLIQLHRRQAGDNEAFYAVNMFPGDSVTHYYCVRVSHSDTVTLRFHATVRNGYEKLAEVLKVRVRAKGMTWYDGNIWDMPSALSYQLRTDKRVTDDVVYEITAYLDTSVGNEYQNQMLVADFSWWVEETNNLSSPQTGDTSGIYLWSALGILSLIALLGLLYILYKKNPQLMRLLIVLILLVLTLSTLCVSVFAAARLGVDVRKNVFKTGSIKINLNDGKPVATYRDGNGYQGNEIFSRFEPGMTVVSDFFIENVQGESTGEVLYKLYFTDVKGALADVLDVTITDDSGRVILYRNKASAFTRTGVGAPMGRLQVGQRQKLKIWFHFPEEAGNAYQGADLSFALCASAVQAKNNPSGVFH